MLCMEPSVEGHTLYQREYFLNKIFVVNQRKDETKWREMKKMLDKQYLSAERIGTEDLTFKQPDNYMTNFVTRYVPNYSKEEKIKLVKYMIGKRSSKKDADILLGHINAWRHIEKRQFEYSLILDDDVELSPRFRDNLHVLLQYVPFFSPGTDLINLGYDDTKGSINPFKNMHTFPKKTTRLTRHGYRIKKPNKIYGYILTDVGARRLLKMIDQILEDKEVKHTLQVISALPKLVFPVRRHRKLPLCRRSNGNFLQECRHPIVLSAKCQRGDTCQPREMPISDSPYQSSPNIKASYQYSSFPTSATHSYTPGDIDSFDPDTRQYKLLFQTNTRPNF
jgi:GR25 family glycosyltransferase involved in LPS biosynthesis